MEKVKIKIIGQTARDMFEVLRNSGKISFANDVIGIKAKSIVDGESLTEFLPDTTNRDAVTYSRGLYTQVNLEDGSIYTVTVDEEENSLIFYFNTTPDKLDGLRETVLSFIDYDYEKRRAVEE
jgi:hypothetical protein